MKFGCAAVAVLVFLALTPPTYGQEKISVYLYCSEACQDEEAELVRSIGDRIAKYKIIELVEDVVSADRIIVFLGRGDVTPRDHALMSDAVTRAVETRRKVITFPVFLSKEVEHDLPLFMEVFVGLDFSKEIQGLSESHVFHRLLASIFGVSSGQNLKERVKEHMDRLELKLDSCSTSFFES